nr:MAG TPA: hypothetical protein [Caudoviricetes sp.]
MTSGIDIIPRMIIKMISKKVGFIAAMYFVAKV